MVQMWTEVSRTKLRLPEMVRLMRKPGGLQGDFEIDVPQEFLEEDEDIVVHEEHEEAVEKAGLPSPLQPTAQEIEEHSIAHVPYRSWCEHCVSR